MDFLTSFIVWSIGVFGTANIISISKIFEPFRNFLKPVPFFGKMVSCVLCTGFWVGVFWGYTMFSPAEYLVRISELHRFKFILDPLFDGATGSAVTWIIYLWTATKMAGK
jgi:hypothetical protein